MLRKSLVVFLIGLLMFGCSPSEKEGETSEKMEPVPTADADLSIAYTLVVSGIPMVGEMTFNQKYITDGETGRVEMESVIPVGQETRTASFATIIDLNNKKLNYVNDVTKTYATIDIPDSAKVPPETSPEMKLEVNPTGEVDTVAGIEVKSLDIALELNYMIQDKPATTTMSGVLWVSDAFTGYDAFKAFKANMKNKIADKRLQSGGFLDFLTRFNMSRDNLDELYDKLSGFPFRGELEFNINEGLPNGFTLTTNLNVTDVSNEAIDKAVFAVPEGYTVTDVQQVMSPAAGG